MEYSFNDKYEEGRSGECHRRQLLKYQYWQLVCSEFQEETQPVEDNEFSCLEEKL